MTGAATCRCVNPEDAGASVDGFPAALSKKIAACARAAYATSRFGLKTHPRAASARRKHRLQRRQQFLQRRRMHGAQALHQPQLVQRAHLVQQHQPRFALKRQANPKGGRLRAGHRRYDHGAQVVVHLGRRHDHARPRFLNLTAHRRGEIGQPDLVRRHRRTVHHTYSASPSLPGSGHASASSPAAASRWLSCEVGVRF